MRPPDSATTADRIGEYWDALVAGAPPDDTAHLAEQIEPQFVETIALLETAEPALMPNDAFMSRFEAAFMATVSSAVAAETGTAAPADPPVLIPLPFPSAAMPGKTRRNRMAPALAVAAALAIVLIGTLVAWQARIDRSPLANQENLIPAPQIGIDVLTDRGNAQRTGVMPGPAIGTAPDVRWQVDAGKGGISAAIVAGDSVVVASGYQSGAPETNPGAVIAIDPVSGAERWRFTTNAGAGTAPVAADGVIFAADSSGMLYAIDAASGSPIWAAELDGNWVASPAVTDDVIYVATTPFRVSLQVALAGNDVFVGTNLVSSGPESTQLYALDLADGRVRWQVDLSERTPGVYALDSTDGTLLWQFSMTSLELGPAVDGQTVFAGSSVERTMYAIDITTGEPRWQFDTGTDLPVNTSPLLANNRIIFNTVFGQTIALDARTGSELWRQSAQHMSFLNSPVVSGSEVLVVDVAGGISAYAIEDGSLLWLDQLTASGQFEAAPVVSGGVLYVGTSLTADSGVVAKLWALSPPAHPAESDTDSS